MADKDHWTFIPDKMLHEIFKKHYKKSSNEIMFAQKGLTVLELTEMFAC